MKLIVITYRKLDTYHFRHILNVTLMLWGVLLLALCAVEYAELQTFSRMVSATIATVGALLIWLVVFAIVLLFKMYTLKEDESVT